MRTHLTTSSVAAVTADLLVIHSMLTQIRDTNTLVRLSLIESNFTNDTMYVCLSGDRRHDIISGKVIPFVREKPRYAQFPEAHYGQR